MQDAKELNPLVNYQPQWLILGIILLVLVAIWIGFIFWITRHRVQKTVANLPVKEVAPPDLAGLKKKYLALVDAIEQESQQGTATPRQTHQKLSLTVRLFAYEASGFRAQVMTLADIKQSRFPQLGQVIEAYYPNEFDAMLNGSVNDALAKARELVGAW